MRKIIFIFGYAAAFLSGSALSATYEYTARVHGKAKMTGQISVSGINWQRKNFEGNGQCTTSLPWPRQA